MNAPPSGPDWLEYLELAAIAMLAALSRGLSWRDPATGRVSVNQIIQAIATAGTIAVGAAAAQSRWNFPWPITAFVAAAAALLGLPFLTASLQAIAAFFLRSRIGESPNAGVPSDKP